MGAMSGLFVQRQTDRGEGGLGLLVDGASGELRRDWLVSLCADVAALRRQGAK